MLSFSYNLQCFQPYENQIYAMEKKLNKLFSAIAFNFCKAIFPHQVKG